MADPQKMAAFAGPKPGEDELDEIDDGIETADDHEDDEEVARLDLLLEHLDEEQALALEECCDELGEGLRQLEEPLPEEEQEILLENIGTMLSDELLDTMAAALGELEDEEFDEMVAALEDTRLFEEPEKIAFLFYHIGFLVDEGLLSVEEEEGDPEGETPEDEEPAEDDLDTEALPD